VSKKYIELSKHSGKHEFITCLELQLENQLWRQENMTIKNRYGTESGKVDGIDMVGRRSAAVRARPTSKNGTRFGNGAGRARYGAAILIALMFILGAFAVLPAQAAGPAAVNLGTAGDFVVLAKTGVSTTGTTHVTGDVGISPAAASYITGFGLIMDSSNEFSTSSVVTGKVYASDYTPPTPTKMTTAISDMETAYTDAAGRTLPDYTELYAGDVTGKTLTPGLYKWGTGLLISAGGVTISGAASDTWIFQIAQDLTVANGAIVTLSGGAKATNIFWQVAGEVTIGTTVAMKGIILCQTQIAIGTGATLVGRALAQTAVTLDANTITIPTDVTAPTVSSTVPLNAATGVAINSAMSATFSEAMDSLTITTTTFTLKQGTTSVSGAVTYSGFTATFKPTANLAASTTYTATITTGAKDLAGNGLASNYVWSFTTGATPDTTPPTVISTVPLNAATGVAINSAMSATFSEAMDPSSILSGTRAEPDPPTIPTTNTFVLHKGTTFVSGAVTYSGFTATFKPTDNLDSSTVYTATITTRAQDLAGNALVANYVWSFTTSAAPDTTPPTVSATINDNGETGVPINTKVGATFSEAMNPLTITTTTFTLKYGTTMVSGTVDYSGVNAVFTPTSNLAPNTLYTATIMGGVNGVKDLAGNVMASNYVWSWTTAATPDTTVPTVISTIPVDAATGVAINSAMSATFSEAMDPLTITTVTFTLKQGTTSVSGTVTYSLVTAVFTPLANLASSTVYTATITTGAKDLAGNAMASNYVWSFTTGAAADTTAPTVISTVNDDGATNVATNTRIAATFSEAMNPLTITTVTFTLKQGTTPVSGTVTYSGVTAVFAPTSTLASNTEYTITITTGVKDLAGNAMASNYVWSWTTGAAPDTAAPTVSATVPLNAASSVSINSAMTATFSEAMNPLTITTSTFALKHGATAVSGTVTYVGLKATFRPAANLAPATVYTATITTGAKDLAGNALATNHVWSFTTSAETNPSTVGTVAGRIVDENGDPIEGANVSVFGYDIYNTTNADGTYSLTEVPGGAQKLNVSMDGYQDQVYDVEVAPDSTTTNPDIVLDKDTSSMNWAWPLLILAALIVLAVLAMIIYSRRKKSPGTK
jgi:hypothetical protein